MPQPPGGVGWSSPRALLAQWSVHTHTTHIYRYGYIGIHLRRRKQREIIRTFLAQWSVYTHTHNIRIRYRDIEVHRYINTHIERYHKHLFGAVVRVHEAGDAVRRGHHARVVRARHGAEDRALLVLVGQ